MALPTKDDLIVMNIAFGGQPFVYVPAKANIDTATLDVAFWGEPFNASPAATVVSIAPSKRMIVVI